MQTQETPGGQPNKGKVKVNRHNCARHLVEKELEMIGKTMLDTLDDMEWYNNLTLTKVQHEEFRLYSLNLIKKIYKVNTSKAIEIFNWFYINHGLRIKG